MSHYTVLGTSQTGGNSILSKVDASNGVGLSSSMVTEFVSPNKSSAVSSEEICKFFIQKLVLSSAPSPMPSRDIHNNNENCRVMAIQGYQESQLAFCRPGDTSWTALDGSLEPYWELLYFKKHQLFYALSFAGSLEGWDLRDPASPKRTLVKLKVPPQVLPAMDDEYQEDLRISCLSQNYLVESSSGEDLLMVRRYYSLDFDDDGEIVTVTPDDLKSSGYQFFFANHEASPSNRKTLAFDVYKLDFDEKKWVHVPSLGDQALFLGLNQSVSLSVRDLPELRGNSIYFTCIDAEVSLDMNDRGAHDMGVFNLEDNSITPLYDCTSKRIQPHPIWIVPTP